MRILLVLLLLFNFSFAQVKLLSWNIENLGKSKSDETINYIANTIKDYDVIAIQEVVAGYGGSQAVVKLVDALNRMGNKWDYTISNPTTSAAYKTERYAFIWKPSKVKKIKEAWLEQKYNLEIDREPYFCTFSYNNKEFTVVNFHAITKSKQPETEIKYFKYFPENYEGLNLIFAGDFNCPQSHTVFNPWRKMNFLPAFKNQKTSLKRACKGNNCLASEFDNIWFNTSYIVLLESKAIHFYKDFINLDLANDISDHIPISISFKLK
jgi:deoxyribonuclease-1-like protein